MTSGNLATLDVIIAGLADRINDTLAGVLLNLGLLEQLVDELADAAGRPRGRSDTVIDDVVGAVARLRDVVKDLQVLTGDDVADAAETFAALLRLVRPELALIELEDRVRGPAVTAMPRRRLATATALAMREVQRALIGCRGTLVASTATVDGEIELAMRATIEPGSAHRLDRADPAWNEIRALLAEHGGHLAIDASEHGLAGGFGIELRLPAAAG